MSLASSPPRDIADLLARRNVTNIPRDQQVLLDDPDSWAVDLKIQPEGLARVPSHVRATTERAYIARISATRTKAARATRPKARSSSSPESTGSYHSQIATQTSYRDASGSPQPSSPDYSAPRSSPPPKPPLTQHANEESPIVRETPKNGAMLPPPRPIQPIDYNFPSSDGPEEELEMAVPQAMTDSNTRLGAPARLQATTTSPVHSSNRLMDTPPCAQGTQVSQPPSQAIIPGTDIANISSTLDQPRGESRRRPMKQFDILPFSPKKKQESVNRLPATKTFTQVDSSLPTSSSSVIPQTEEDKTQPTPVLVPSIEDLQNATDVVAVAADVPSRYASEELQPDEVAHGKHMTVDTNEEVRPAPLEIAPGSDTKPFDVFTQLYPHYMERYSGSLWDFIVACVCLDHLRIHRLLQESSFDEFIRKFTEYRTYLRTRNPGDKELPAIEWFNDAPGQRVFHGMVVTKQNLGYILDSYPREVAQASRVLADGDNETHGARTPTPVPDEMEVKEPDSPVIFLGETRPMTLTQAPPPPSPQLGGSPTTLRSTMATPASRMRPPRPSQYFDRLTSTAKSKPKTKPNSTATRRSSEDRQQRLREHIRQRRSGDTRSVTSSRFGR